MDYNIICLLIVFIVLLLVLGLAGLIFYFIIKFLRNQFRIQNKFLQNWNLKIGITFLIVATSIYLAYTAVFPRDSFYFEEFKYVSLQKIPTSAIIKEKESSYPDFHGDYYSKSTIELSKSDFQHLLNKIESDKKLTKLPTQQSNELAVFQRNIRGKSDKFLYITFLKDGKTIIVDVNFT